MASASREAGRRKIGWLGERKRYPLTLGGSSCVLGERTWVMGVLNVTPDSFSDGARFAEPEAALEHGLAMFEAGADIVDVGGESTRPGGARVGTAEETRRVVPVIGRLREARAGHLSVDTTRAEVAREALAAGAELVNDISGFRFDPRMAPLLAQSGAAGIVMHLRGDFETMHDEPAYADVAAEIVKELGSALDSAERAGVRRERLIVDPGIGFAKRARHSLEALRSLPALAALERPVLVGPSRKSFIGQVLELPVGERLMGTAAAVAACVLAGAHVVRVHDVAPLSQVVRMCDAIRAGQAAAC